MKIDLLNETTSLGIEFGSTRIKSVLLDSTHKIIAVGTYDWENQLVNDFWTYSLDEIWKGLQNCYADLNQQIITRYGEPLKKIGSIGISGMMHGYLPLDKKNNLLVPFRTWRNSNTSEAETKLTTLFQFNIPQRWSIAHLYQAILNQEDHVKDIHFLTTLSGFIHFKLTGEKVLGIGDASGMFPIDSSKKIYHEGMLNRFNAIESVSSLNLHLETILPKILLAGQKAGRLTVDGAKLLDPSLQLEPGVPFCPPEGDAGTGMVATNSIKERTGNVSAGTSVFSMIVLEKSLSTVHQEIDIVTTPEGLPVAMVHANNCTSDINGWVKIFEEFGTLFGLTITPDDLYGQLFQHSLTGNADAGGLLSYGYYSGENITHMSEGRPLFVHSPNSHFTLANFMRSHLFSSLSALKIGMDILNQEQVEIDQINGHGGLFKTPIVGQRYMAAAMNTNIGVMETASEGGAWGMALLASYMMNQTEKHSLVSFLNQKIFNKTNSLVIEPFQEDIDGFNAFLARYKQGLPIEQAAINHLN